MSEGLRVIVWLDPEQVELARLLCDRLGGEIVGVGSPASTRLGEIAKNLGAVALDDARAALASEACDVFLITSAQGLGGRAGSGELNAALDAQSRGVKIASLVPPAGSALDLHAGGWMRASNGVTAAECIRFVPLVRAGSGPVAMRERLVDFGRISAVSIEMVSRAEEGSLGGHLFAAMQFIHSLLGEGESVEAAYHPPGPWGTLRPVPADSLHDLRGGLTAHVRTIDARGVTLFLSDQGARWSRELLILGDGGQMRVSDDAFEWIGTDGKVVDSTESETSGGVTEENGAARAIAGAIGAILSNHPSESQPIDVISALAMGQASLLSARTGQSESPGTILRMVRAG